MKGCRRVRVRDETEALNVLFEGDTNRIIAATPLNPASSRSHCIFTIYIENIVGGKSTNSKLALVDLAGSERVMVLVLFRFGRLGLMENYFERQSISTCPYII